jgi:phytoene dehydrogenase-like protein
MRLLARLGLAPAGGVPSPSGGYAVTDHRLHALPGGLVSLMSTGLLDLRGKLEAARWLARLQKATQRWDGLAHTTVSDWAARAVADRGVRALLLALIRLSTYSAAPELESAGAALDQLGFAVRANVLYLDGGWAALVASLAKAAQEAGAILETGSRVDRVLFDPSGARAIGVEIDGRAIEARAVVLSVPPREVERMLGPSVSAPLGLGGLEPVRAACLDLGLRSLPDPRALFALGIDRPLYLSVHSAVARLAPGGGALVHLAKYLPPLADASFASAAWVAERIARVVPAPLAEAV